MGAAAGDDRALQHPARGCRPRRADRRRVAELAGAAAILDGVGDRGEALGAADHQVSLAEAHETRLAPRAELLVDALARRPDEVPPLPLRQLEVDAQALGRALAVGLRER